MNQTMRYMYEMFQDIDYERQKKLLEKQIKDELTPYGKYISGKRELLIDKEKIKAMLTSTLAKELLEQRVFVSEDVETFAFPLHYNLETHYLYDPQGFINLEFLKAFLEMTINLPSIEADIMATAKEVSETIQSFVKPLEDNKKLNEAVEKLKALSWYDIDPFEDAYTEDVYQRFIDEILPIESEIEGIDPERRFFAKSLRPMVDDAVGSIVWRFGITDENELAYVKDCETHDEVIYINLDQRTIRLKNHYVGGKCKCIEKGTFEEFEQGHKSVERFNAKVVLDGIKQIEQFLKDVHKYQKSKEAKKTNLKLF